MSVAFIPAVSGVVVIWGIERIPSGLVAIHIQHCAVCSLSRDTHRCINDAKSVSNQHHLCYPHTLNGFHIMSQMVRKGKKE